LQRQLQAATDFNNFTSRLPSPYVDDFMVLELKG
jgi:hypothetical protein